MVLDDLFRHQAAQLRFAMPPLGPEVDVFGKWFHRKEFSRHGIRRRVWQASNYNYYPRPSSGPMAEAGVSSSGSMNSRRSEGIMCSDLQVPPP